MGVDVEVYRPFWAADGALSEADQGRIEGLLADQRFWDAYDLCRERGVDLNAAGVELERSDLYSFELFFLAELHEIYGSSPNEPTLLSRIQRLRQAGEVVFVASDLDDLAGELAATRRLGQAIQAPKLEMLPTEPAHPGRWLIVRDPRSGRPADGWTLFAERDAAGEAQLIFHPGRWTLGDRWREDSAVRLRRPCWDGDRFAYVDDGGDRAYPIPHMRNEMRELEGGEWTRSDDGWYFVDATGRQAAVPTHPLWDGPANLEWTASIEHMAETLERLEAAVAAAREVGGVVVLS